MWKNYFSVALRGISKNKLISLINVSGLAIGLASAILILLFILRELSFDRHHEHADQIHRMYIDGGMGEQSFRGAWTSMVMAPTFAAEIEEIEAFVRFDVYNQQLIWSSEKKSVEDNFMFADSSLFDIFTIPLVRGDPATALDRPKSVVITQTKARQYFGDMDPLGQALTINSDSNYYVVTGVMEEFPGNSHFYADFIASMSTLDYSRAETWFQNSIFSYLRLHPDAERPDVEEKMAAVMQEHIRVELENILGMGPEEWEAGGNRYGVFLQPLLDIHLQPDIDTGLEICFRPVSERRYIYIFALIAFFILLIASINFMNLSTARSALRTREVSLRKVAGSSRALLIRQFLTESVVLSLIALIVALILVEMALPWFNRVMDLDLRMDRGRSLYLLPVFLLLTVVVGLLSGLYPAVFMSGFKPVEGFSWQHGGFRAGILRNVLVVIQFSISVAIIIGTLVVSTQLNYLITKDLGYEKDQVLVLKRVYPLGTGIQAFCRELEKIPGVDAASNSTTYLGFSNSTESYQIEGRDASRNYLFGTNYVDYHFQASYQFKLIGEQSRFFDPSRPEDSLAILVNKAAVEEYEMEDPFSTVILEPAVAGDTNRLRVIGVVDNFHHSNLREAVGPYMLRFKPENNEWAGYISIRLGVAGKGLPSTLRKIKALWMEMSNEAPFQYFFLDEELEQYYKEERRTGRLSLMFALMATFIACMGLFGLSLHNTRHRTREIGIRKAMGAGIGDVLLFISREILVLVGISILLAWVLAYIFMDRWLADFPYHIGFRPWIYLIAAGAAVLIALLSVSFLTYRTARSNPASVLHHE